MSPPTSWTKPPSPSGYGLARRRADQSVWPQRNRGTWSRLQRRLTSTRGDDRPLVFSPDGAWLVISTSRWNANGRANLALIDGRTGSLVRRLTYGHDRYESDAWWSPDGAQLAFVRQVIDQDSTQLCLLTIDGTHERCRDFGFDPAIRLIGFVGESRVLLTTRGGAAKTAFTLDLASGAIDHTAIPEIGNPTLDPSGRWLLITQASDDASRAILVGPTLDFARARRIERVGVNGTRTIVWFDGSEPDYVSRLAIRHPRSAVPRGVPFQLAVEATTRDGKRATPSIVLWRSLSPRLASVDSTGVLLARDTGSVVVEASLGGWRVAVDTMHVAAPPSTIVAEERWRGDVAARWRFYGEPRLQIVDDGRGGLAFFNNGDGVFYSGAYSLAAYRANDGIAVDVDISTPVTRNQWQMVTVSVNGDSAFADVGRWDHKTGYLPFHSTGEAVCLFVYPQGEGPNARLRSNFANPLPRVVAGRPLKLWSGGWHRVRVQLFPDGRCGQAIDGERVSVTASSGVAPASARVLVQGNSVGTRLLVGRLRVYSGVPPGVDWNNVPKQH